MTIVGNLIKIIVERCGLYLKQGGCKLNVNMSRIDMRINAAIGGVIKMTMIISK